MGAGEVSNNNLQAGVYLVNGKKYKLSEDDLKKMSGEITKNELQALLNGKEVTDADAVTVGYGSRGAAKKTGENRVQFSMDAIAKNEYPLVDDKGKANKDIQKKRYEEIKAEFAKQESVATNDQKLNEAIETSFGPQLDKLAKSVSARDENANKVAFYQLCFTDEEKAEVDRKLKGWVETKPDGTKVKHYGLNEQMAALMGVPGEDGKVKELTEEEKKQLEQLKNEFNKRYPGQLGENESFDVRGVDSYYAHKRFEQAKALMNLMAIEDGIAARQLASGDATASGTLTPAQERELARGELKEQITHKNQINKIRDKMQNDKSLTQKDIEKLQSDIQKLRQDSIKKYETIEEQMLHESAESQLEFETYKQNFENTVVSWDKKSAKEAEKANPDANNTHLEKDHREIIMREPAKFGCRAPKAGETPTFTDKNGQAWVFDSERYKHSMLKLSNGQSPDPNVQRTNTTKDADYYASTSEFVRLATENKNAEALEETKEKKRLKAQAKPATMGDRTDARQMFAIAGLQVAGDNTYKKRGKEIGKAALAGGGAGGLAALGGELYKCASTVKYSGTVLALAQGVVNTTVSGIGTTTVEGTVSGTTTVTGEITGEVSGPISGTVFGDVSGPISGEVSGPISGTITGTGNSTVTTITGHTDPLTGAWTETGRQTTTTPVTITGEGTGIGHGTGTGIGYGQGTGTGTGIGHGTGTGTGSAKVDWTDSYKKDVQYEYKEDVSVEYEKEVEAPYEGQARPKFEPINILKGAAIGAGTAAGLKGLSYLFKKKTKDDYANDETVKDKFRSSYGYEIKEEPEAIAELGVETIEAPEVCDATMEEKVVQQEVKIENHGYKLQRGETLSSVIAAKYGITNSKDLKAAIREVRRATGIPENGIVNGQAAVPHIEVDGKTLADAYWLPDSILDGKYDLDLEKKAATMNYRKVGVAVNGKNTASISQSSSGMYIVKDKCGNILYNGPDRNAAVSKRDAHNAEQARIRAEWNKQHPLDQI